MNIVKSIIIISLSLLLVGCETEQDILQDIEDDTVTTTIISDDSVNDVVVLDSAVDNEYGSLGALNDMDFTIEEMLIYAIQDEYAARSEYEYILNTFDVTKPFSNIITSEETHIALLIPLFEEFSITLPPDTSSEHLLDIDSLEETFAVGVIAEEYNIAMYNAFLDQEDLPESLVDAFTKLRDASINHLAAFQKNADRYN